MNDMGLRLRAFRSAPQVNGPVKRPVNSAGASILTGSRLARTVCTDGKTHWTCSYLFVSLALRAQQPLSSHHRVGMQCRGPTLGRLHMVVYYAAITVADMSDPPLTTNTTMHRCIDGARK